MFKIAIMQFPGSNCELETMRAVERAGMEAVLWRWNRSTKKLSSFDGYIIPGGFSYEDRVRAGVVAAHDPVIAVVREAARVGKPVLGICNGAQILVEARLVPGVDSDIPHAQLSVNKKVDAQGQLVGSGFYNQWVYVRSDHAEGKTAFTQQVEEGTTLRMPIANGEGRFLFNENELDELIKNGQAVFRYCDSSGLVDTDYPVCPNGAQYALAGVSNERGNVLALMPHPERTQEGQIFFDSIRLYLEQGELTHSDSNTSATVENEAKEERSVQYELSRYFNIDNRIKDDLVLRTVTPELYEPCQTSVEFFVELVIADNVAETLESLLARRGITHLRTKRYVHWQVDVEPGLTADWSMLESIIVALIKSDELLNINKENPLVRFDKEWYTYHSDGLHEASFEIQDHVLMTRDKEDLVGEQKLATLQNRLDFHGIEKVTRGVVWSIGGIQKNEAREYLMKHHILANPIGQKIYNLSA